MKFGIYVGFDPQISNLKFFINWVIGFTDRGCCFFDNFMKNGMATKFIMTISPELVVQSGKVKYLWKGEKARNSNLASFLSLG